MTFDIISNKLYGTKLLSYKNPIFTKDSVTGLVWWIDAALEITKDVGNLVSDWGDQSVSNVHIAQSSATNKPLYVASGINGLPTVRFDGVDNYMVSGAIACSQPMTVFIVCKLNASSANRYLVSFGSTVECSPLITSGTNKWYAYAGTAGVPSVANSDTSAHIFMVKLNGTSSALKVDAVNATGSLGTRGLEKVTLGNYHLLGAYWSNMDMSEILVYNSILTTAEEALVSTYLQKKYNL